MKNSKRDTYLNLSVIEQMNLWMYVHPETVISVLHYFDSNFR